jgi:mannose-1-phosphate guanylyltransferase
MQALILTGGLGTRLRPLTSNLPKPIVPLVGQPFIGYMLDWLRRHGIDDIVLACGFRSDGVRDTLGDGEHYGVRLRYVEEPEPLGTGGAVKYAQDLLDERFFMLNGDVLTDLDLTAELEQHERTGAQATLALIPVEDVSAYGLVRRRADLSVSEFVEKPNPDQAMDDLEFDTNLVNAGAYIIERSLLEKMPAAGTNFSIERDVFPKLVGKGLYGYEACGYWLDIGTPQRYLQATFDILDGNVRTAIGDRLRADGLRLIGNASVEGRVSAPALIGSGARIARTAVVGGRVVLGDNVEVQAGVRIDSSVVLDGAVIGQGSVISGSIIDRDARIGAHCHLSGHAIVGRGVDLGAENTLAAGVRIFPGVVIPDGAVRF